MKNLIVTLMIGLTSITAVANEDGKTEESKDIPFNIKGKVIDKITQEPLTGVSIFIEETGEYVFTDFDGNFSYATYHNSQFHLRFSLISFEDKVKVFDVEKNVINIAL